MAIVFPFIRQTDTMDCGPACLQSILLYYNVQRSLNIIKEYSYCNREGVSLLGLSDAADALGFHSYGVKLSWEQLRDEAYLPCIVHWNQNHFVVVYKIAKRRGKWHVFVSDPAMGLLKYTEEQFLNSWLEIEGLDDCVDKGVALLLEPTPSLYTQSLDMPIGEEHGFNLKRLTKYLIPHRRSIFQIFLAMSIISFLSLLLPCITQSIVDRGVLLGNLGFVKTMLVAQMLILLGQLANNVIRNWLMLHMTTHISICLISDFLAKLMRLPISFFDTKMTGDIMQRIQDYDRIRDFLTNTLLGIAMAIVLLVIYGAILGGYNFGILCVFMVGTALYISWVLTFLRWRRKIDYMRFQEAANNQSSVVQLIGGMQEIKLNNCEKHKRWEWEHIQTNLFRISIKGLSLSQTQQIGGAFIDQIKNIIISFLAAKSVIDGDMTIGMMTALTYIIGQLNAPVTQFISFVRECQDANISMERLNEIHERKDEEDYREGKIQDIPTNANLEFRNVTFQYEGPHSPNVLDDISFQVPYGKITAIVGTSGSGKTTMLKMMLGFYLPSKGTITLDGVELKKYSESAWRKQCGCVMQEGFIFSNSIAENIALSDQTLDMERVRKAAEVANIHKWIEKLPLGYNTKIGADGHGLSVGQKQRILIARAAYKNSPYLFFDEATNALDANNERAIMDNLNSFFKDKTVVIIAHRLSTVKNADNIIVLNNGHIVEKGSHIELIARKGCYYELVRNQLELGN